MNINILIYHESFTRLANGREIEREGNFQLPKRVEKTKKQNIWLQK